MARIGDAEGMALGANHAGVAWQYAKKPGLAMEFHRKHAAVAGLYGKSVALINLGLAQMEAEEGEAALGSFAEALRHAQNEDDMQLESLAYGNLGFGHLRTGHLKEARTNMEQCLELCSLVGYVCLLPQCR